MIIENDSLLLIHRVKGNKEYWVFPGGGLEESDISLHDGLQRECEEELGVIVSVGDFFAEEVFNAPTREQTEIFYFCRITGGQIGTGKGPESTRDSKKFGIYELQWVPISVLMEKNVQPNKIRDKVFNLFR